MGEEKVFLSMPPNLRAYALVGHYLQSFALMESSLNDAVGSALGIRSLQKAIICKNIQLRDKTKILRTLVAVAPLSAESRAAYDKVILRIGDLSTDRNMLAHDMFDADPEGNGVEFHVTKANGKLSFPETKWSVEEVDAKSDELLAIGAKLRELRNELLAAEFAAILLAPHPTLGDGMPMGSLFQLGAEGPASLPLPSTPDSAPQGTTSAKSPQTPGEPEEE